MCLWNDVKEACYPSQLVYLSLSSAPSTIMHRCVTCAGEGVGIQALQKVGPAWHLWCMNPTKNNLQRTTKLLNSCIMQL